MQMLKEKLSLKFKASTSESCAVCFRFPDGERLEHLFSVDYRAKVKKSKTMSGVKFSCRIDKFCFFFIVFFFVVCCYFCRSCMSTYFLLDISVNHSHFTPSFHDK